MKKAVLAVAAVVVVAAVALGAWLIVGGDDEVSARDTCNGSAYELAVEDEDGGLEVTFELQSTGPGEAWDVVIEQDGTAILSGPRTTDEDGELDLDAPVDEGGASTFEVVATPAQGEPCVATATR